MNKRNCANCFWSFNDEDENNLEEYKDDDSNKPQAGDCCLGMEHDSFTCSCHEYIDGMEEYENYVIYDETYHGTGYFIITKLDDEIVKFMKIISFGEGDFSKFIIIGYEKNKHDILEENPRKITFTIPSQHPLYEIIWELNKCIRNDKLYSVDKVHGDSYVKIESYLDEVSIVLNKDIFAPNNPTDFFEVLLGDNYTCEYYEAMYVFYNKLGEISLRKSNEEDMKRILSKLK